MTAENDDETTEQQDSAAEQDPVDDELDEDYESELDTEAFEEPEPGERMPLLPRLAAIFAFIIPPVGAVMGHLWQSWEGPRNKWRRPALTGIWVGWPMTVVFVVAITSTVTWMEYGNQDAREAERLEEAESEQRAQLQEAAVQSDSAGEVDAPMCDQLFGQVIPQTPETGFVYEYGQIDQELVGSYEQLSEETTLYGEAYADYAAHLSSFDSADEFEQMDDQEHAEHVEPLLEAVNEDMLGCIDLDYQYFEDFAESELDPGLGDTP